MTLRSRAAAVLLAVLMVFSVAPSVASAHSGGLDRNGGHHCRERGYRSGSCRPLNSYHCHRSPCRARR